MPHEQSHVFRPFATSGFLSVQEAFETFTARGRRREQRCKTVSVEIDCYSTESLGVAGNIIVSPAFVVPYLKVPSCSVAPLSFVVFPTKLMEPEKKKNTNIKVLKFVFLEPVNITCFQFLALRGVARAPGCPLPRGCRWRTRVAA